MLAKGLPSESALILATVRNAARLGRDRADAVMVIDLKEHERRRVLGVGAVTTLHLLDTLLKMPLDRAVSETCLIPRDQDRVADVAPGLVERGTDGLTRRLKPAAEVVSVRVTAGTWSTKLLKAAAFSKFVPTEVILSRAPSVEQMIQADYFGIGLSGSGPVAGELFVRPSVPAAAFKAVDWQFFECAFQVWLSAEGDRGENPVVDRRQVRRGSAEQDRTR